ncbi:MAG: hypothetical protein U0790_09715 [Isosphaeraceae bacterium]
MRIRHIVLPVVAAALVGFATTARAQLVQTTYVVPSAPVVMGAPMVPAAPFGTVVGTPVVPYATGYRVMTPRPWYGFGPVTYGYRSWGYRPRVWGGGYRYGGWGRRWR